MKALCVTESRDLVVRDIPSPIKAAHGHVIVEMIGSAINPGDKTFLRMPTAAGSSAVKNSHDVWGASGVGKVVAIGSGVPEKYINATVAIYRSLGRTPDCIGLWCEVAQMIRPSITGHLIKRVK